MIYVLPLIALGVVAWRLRRRELSQEEVAVAAVAIISLGVVFLQSLIADYVIPEGRYYKQIGTLLVPWTVWAALRLKYGRRILIGLIAILAVYHGVMFAKPHMPGTRRKAYVSACEWAAELIRRDWHGPSRDEAATFSVRDYHLPHRPCVHGITPRLAYLVGGRDESLHVFGEIDRPDYWLTGRFDDEFRAEDYALMGEFTSGRYRFSLYRRK